jgi:uncharacterized damage-inducible protein DinB
MVEQNQAATEPWMRGTHAELDPLRRAVVHALDLAEEDVARWATNLSDEDILSKPYGLPSVGFHLRHIVRSLDRLLTYAEGRMLSEPQLAALRTEMDAGSSAEVLREFREGIENAKVRVLAFSVDYAAERGVGRKRLPTTVGGLLVHCAEHTQRHVGQMVTTVKLVQALASEGSYAGT